MKNLKVTLAAMMIALFAVVGTSNVAKAQTANTGDLLAGLLNVNVSLVEAAVATGDITVQDVVDIDDINILNDAINNNEVLSRNQRFLNNLLRDADIITGNQVVVGIVANVLSAGYTVFVVDKATTKKGKKK